MKDEQKERQKESLRKTLEEKERLHELMKTDPEMAVAQLMKMGERMRRRPQGISSTNATRARKFKKDHCEICGSKEYLLVHHKDHNQSNNVAENLQTLCSSCHHEVHELRDRMPWE